VTGIGTQYFVLPIKLLSFNCKIKEKAVESFWETSLELDNHRFEIEHSIDGREFNKIEKLLEREHFLLADTVLP
jgi:hypothetical protein